MSLDKWLAKQLQVAGLNKKVVFTNRDLEYWLHKVIWLNTVLHPHENKGELSQQARMFYRENVLKNLLPLLSLELPQQDLKELHNLDITESRWGFIHSGALWLKDSGANLEGLTLTDIEDTGVTLSTLLCDGLAPRAYAGYLRLPALFHYVGTSTNVTDLASINEQSMQQIFLSYLDHLRSLAKKNNPLTALPDLIEGWKTRTELAKDELHRHNLSEKWVTSYLNHHGEMQFGGRRWEETLGSLNFYNTRYRHPSPESNKRILLPNIDTVFQSQNLELTNVAYEVDKLLLPPVFNSLSREEQEFIEKSKIDRVRIQFNARSSIYKVPLSHLTLQGLDKAGALQYHIPDHIDLLACSLRGQEHIYALKTAPRTKKYQLQRVDRDREALLLLLEDSCVPSNDPDYKIKVTSHSPLKQENDLPQKFIENLAELHRKKLLKELTDQGYDKTTKEKMKDFLLSLIPLYTCINESRNGHKHEAITACIVDIASLIPFGGRAAVVGMRFGTSLAGSTAMALKYGVRQLTIKEMFKQTGKELMAHSHFIAKEISPQIVHGLSTEFLNDLDPGFGLSASVGTKGLRAMENLLIKIPDRSPGIIRLSEALTESFKIESLFSPTHGKFIDVAILGTERGQAIWSQINAETGMLYRQKFVRNADGYLEVYPLKVRHRNEKLVEVTEKIKIGNPVQEQASGSGRDVDRIKSIGVGILAPKNIAKRYIKGSNYIQYYTRLPNNIRGSKILVLSSHGGFIDADMDAPVVLLLSDITIKLLTPHGTTLIDPGLENIVNAGRNLRAYVTIQGGEVSEVDFLSQKENPEWLYSADYDPENVFNTLGREDGLQNYRHYRYEGESDKFIGRVLIKNRWLVSEGKAILTDILTVRNKIDAVIKTSREKTSIQKVLDLDKEGKLLNEKGERYKTIIFCHCRCDFFPMQENISGYSMYPLEQLGANEMRAWPKDSITTEVMVTELTRKDMNGEFEFKQYSLGRFLFVFNKTNIISTQSSTLIN